MERTEHYNYAFLDEGSKREIRRCILKAVAIPGYQVPFGSRELPIGRGWGNRRYPADPVPHRPVRYPEGDRPGQR